MEMKQIWIIYNDDGEAIAAQHGSRDLWMNCQMACHRGNN